MEAVIEENVSKTLGEIPLNIYGDDKWKTEVSHNEIIFTTNIDKLYCLLSMKITNDKYYCQSLGVTFKLHEINGGKTIIDFFSENSQSLESISIYLDKIYDLILQNQENISNDIIESSLNDIINVKLYRENFEMKNGQKIFVYGKYIRKDTYCNEDVGLVCLKNKDMSDIVFIQKFKKTIHFIHIKNDISIGYHNYKGDTFQLSISDIPDIKTQNKFVFPCKGVRIDSGMFFKVISDMYEDDVDIEELSQELVKKLEDCFCFYGAEEPN